MLLILGLRHCERTQGKSHYNIIAVALSAVLVAPHLRHLLQSSWFFSNTVYLKIGDSPAVTAAREITWRVEDWDVKSLSQNPA